MVHHTFSFPEVGSHRERRLIHMEAAHAELIHDADVHENEVRHNPDASAETRAADTVGRIGRTVADMDPTSPDRVTLQTRGARLQAALDVRRAQRNAVATQRDSFDRTDLPAVRTAFGARNSIPGLNPAADAALQTALKTQIEDRLDKVYDLANRSWDNTAVNMSAQMIELARQIAQLQTEARTYSSTATRPELQALFPAPDALKVARGQATLKTLRDDFTARRDAVRTAAEAYSNDRTPANLEALRTAFRDKGQEITDFVMDALDDYADLDPNVAEQITVAAEQFDQLEELFTGALRLPEGANVLPVAFTREVRGAIAPLNATSDGAAVGAARTRLEAAYRALPPERQADGRAFMQTEAMAKGYRVTVEGTNVALTRVESLATLPEPFRNGVRTTLSRLTATSTGPDIEAARIDLQNAYNALVGDPVKAAGLTFMNDMAALRGFSVTLNAGNVVLARVDATPEAVRTYRAAVDAALNPLNATSTPANIETARAALQTALTNLPPAEREANQAYIVTQARAKDFTATVTLGATPAVTLERGPALSEAVRTYRAAVDVALNPLRADADSTPDIVARAQEGLQTALRALPPGDRAANQNYLVDRARAKNYVATIAGDPPTVRLERAPALSEAVRNFRRDVDAALNPLNATSTPANIETAQNAVQAALRALPPGDRAANQGYITEKAGDKGFNVTIAGDPPTVRLERRPATPEAITPAIRPAVDTVVRAIARTGTATAEQLRPLNDHLATLTTEAAKTAFVDAINAELAGTTKQLNRTVNVVTVGERTRPTTTPERTPEATRFRTAVENALRILTRTSNAAAITTAQNQLKAAIEALPPAQREANLAFITEQANAKGFDVRIDGTNVTLTLRPASGPERARERLTLSQIIRELVNALVDLNLVRPTPEYVASLRTQLEQARGDLRTAEGRTPRDAAEVTRLQTRVRELETRLRRAEAAVANPTSTPGEAPDQLKTVMDRLRTYLPGVTIETQEVGGVRYLKMTLGTPPNPVASTRIQALLRNVPGLNDALKNVPSVSVRNRVLMFDLRGVNINALMAAAASVEATVPTTPPTGPGGPTGPVVPPTGPGTVVTTTVGVKPATQGRTNREA